MFRLVLSFLLLAITAKGIIAQDAISFYKEGLKLKTEKKYSEAKEKFQHAVQLNNKFSEALFELGWCENELKEYRDAINHLLNISEAWVDIGKAYFELGYAYENSENINAAIENYKRCIIFKSDYFAAYRQLGGIEFNQKNYCGAATYYQNGIANSSDEIKDYQLWYRKGFSENKCGKYAQARASLLYAFTNKKDDIKTLLELGFANQKLNNYEEAIGTYKKAALLDSLHYEIYNIIGDIYRENISNMPEAIIWYKKVININPVDKKANFGLGYCCNNIGKYEEAIPYLVLAIQKDSKYVPALIELGYSYYKTNNFAEATEYLNRSITLNSSDVNARYYLALMYIKQKNKESAQQVIEELKKLSSKYAEDLEKKIALL
jgi:tetratricopeptide (TPR) repeat protein